MVSLSFISTSKLDRIGLNPSFVGAILFLFPRVISPTTGEIPLAHGWLHHGAIQMGGLGDARIEAFIKLPVIDGFLQNWIV